MTNSKQTGTVGNKQPCDLISVIMPCFNAEKYLCEAIESVLEQTYPHVELVVVDDGSTDRSKDILRSYGERIVLIEQENQGPYPARNLGIKNSKGKFIAFLDADDYWREDGLERLYASLTASDADLAYCGWQNIGEGAPGGQPYVPPKYEAEDIVSLFLKSCPWPIHAALIRREVIEAVGGFSERYFSSMDYDLWLRICALTKNMILVPDILAFYRWHNTGQISAVKWKQVLNSWKVRKDFIRKNQALVNHISYSVLRQKTDGYLLKCAYESYWKRDLDSARHLFRKALVTRGWGLKDLRYLLPSLLPERLYHILLHYADSKKDGTQSCG